MLSAARFFCAAALAASVTRCGMCEPDTNPQPAAPASASALGSVSGARMPPRPSSLPGRATPPKLACRAIAAEGDVHIEAALASADAGAAPVTAVLLEGLVPTEGWLAVATGGRLVAKDPRTTRETTFRGPARVRACVGNNEESWLAAGAFESSPGAGETPGAEEWVVTPLGVVRYSAAKLSVEVSKGGVKLVVNGGEAFLWRADDAKARGADSRAETDDGWLRADGGAVDLTGTGSSTLAGARGAVARCEVLGKAAHDLSAVLLAGGADAATVTTQVSTRRQAKAACAVAALRLAALPAGGTPAGDAAPPLAPLERDLAEGNAGWSTLPPAPPSGP